MNMWRVIGYGVWLMFGLQTVCSANPSIWQLVKTGEYIDLDSHRLKLLFKAPVGSEITVEYGVDPKQLNLRTVVQGYAPEQGVVLQGLLPNTQYFYRITASYQQQTRHSELHPFNKLKLDQAPANAAWAKHAIFYHVLVRSFFDSNGDGIGDFKGLEAKLDYIQSLGADALWLLPVLESPSDHGFDVTNYYKTEPDYGSNAEFEQLIQAAHTRGLKVIMDLVVNHSSSLHPWFAQGKLGATQPYRDYYVWQDGYSDLTQLGSWNQVAWRQDKQGANGAYWAVFVSAMPDLNLRNPALRAEIKQIAKFWLDKGIDGFRLDAAKHIDEDQDVTLAWWREFNDWMKRDYPDAFLVGEVWDYDYHDVASYMGVMDSAFDFGLQSHIAKLLQGEDVPLLQRVQAENAEFAIHKVDFINSTFLSNHDIDRISAEVRWKKPLAKQAASLLLTLPGTPFIYYGDELGQRGKGELGRAPFDWYATLQGEGQTNWLRTSFNKPNDGISVQEQLEDPNSSLRHYQRLIAIRKNNPVLFHGAVSAISMSNDAVLAYQISDMDTRVVVFHNLSDQLVEITVPEQVSQSLYQTGSVQPGERFLLQPRGVEILR